MTGSDENPAADTGPAPPAIVGETPSTKGLCCAGCGYDLAGLAVAGVCPECAMEIEESIRWWEERRLHPLARGGRRWIGMLRAGSGIVFFGALLAIGMVVWTWWIDTVGAPAYSPLDDPVALVLYFGIVLATVAGMLLLSVREPGVLELRWSRARRWMMRCGAVALVAALTPGVREAFDPWLGPPQHALFVLFSLVSVMAFAAMFAHMGWLSARAGGSALGSVGASLAVVVSLGAAAEWVAWPLVYDWARFGDLYLTPFVAMGGLCLVGGRLTVHLKRVLRRFDEAA